MFPFSEFIRVSVLIFCFYILIRSNLNSSLVSDIYVGDDGNLHKVIGGADTVLPFKGKMERLPNSVIVSNVYKQLIINTSGYNNILVFDYCSQWYIYSSVPVGIVNKLQVLNPPGIDGTLYTTLTYVENITNEQIILYRTGGGTGAIRTPIIYGF